MKFKEINKLSKEEAEEIYYKEKLKRIKIVKTIRIILIVILLILLIGIIKLTFTFIESLSVGPSDIPVPEIVTDYTGWAHS